ncbi:unnamed protein product [Lampetra fluviatilis]
MTSRLAEEMALNQQHEEILARRAVALRAAERLSDSRAEGLPRALEAAEAAAAKRCAMLQCRYWASVERLLPDWEGVLHSPDEASTRAEGDAPPAPQGNA